MSDTVPVPPRIAPAAGTADAVRRQLAFVVEADRLKSVIRQTSLVDGSRRENTAEHSWHLALLATVMAEHAGAAVNVERATRMALVHDLVEIDAGDTFAYDAGANEDRVERERRAADRIFGLLPPEQGSELRALWDEFEAGTSEDARYAVALDRLQPLLNNHFGGGGSWRTHGVRESQVLRRMAPIERALPAVWPTVLEIVRASVASGSILTDDAPTHR